MSKINKVSKWILPVLLAAFICLTLLNALTFNRAITAAEAKTTSSGQTEPQGLVTKMTLSIDGGNGYITATAKNSFTLFPSTIWVYVELYSSETYQESYVTMQLRGMNTISDLNMGKTLTVSVPTDGQALYWQARMRYKFDSNDWVAKTTSTFLFDGNGNEVKF